MKKSFIVMVLIMSSISVFSQWNNTGDNSTTGNLSIKGNIYFADGRQLTVYPNDNFTYDNKSMGHYAFRWGDDSWVSSGSGVTFWLSSYSGIKLFTAGKPRFVINVKGNIGIGTTDPQGLLDVNGTIRSKEVKIEATNWSDFVFASDYKLPSLNEVETHIKKHKHLPDIPSEAEVIENGISVGDMQAKLLQKIEELTLYVIEQDKKIVELQEKLEKK